MHRTTTTLFIKLRHKITTLFSYFQIFCCENAKKVHFFTFFSKKS